MTVTQPTPYYPPRPMNGGDPTIFGMDFGLVEEDWVVEPKLNGCRVLIHLRTGAVFNRHGELFTSSSKIEVAKKKLLGRMRPYLHLTTDKGDPLISWIDAEALVNKGLRNGEGSIVVFDVDAIGDLDFRRCYFNHLLKFPLLKQARSNACYAMPRYPLRMGPKMWESLKDTDAVIEGVVKKRRQAPYAKNWSNPSKECQDFIKHRFH